MSEHTVAIVSFEGALKREIKRVRKELQQVEDLSTFRINITASGRVHQGEVKLVYNVAGSEYGSDQVTGDNLQACLDEFLRRHGWHKVHAAKALGYERIPSDDSDEHLASSDDPF